MPLPALRRALHRACAAALAPPQLAPKSAAVAARSLLPLAARNQSLAALAAHGFAAPPAAGGTPAAEQKLVMYVPAPSQRLSPRLRACVVRCPDASRCSYRGPALQLFRLLVRFKVAQLSGAPARPRVPQNRGAGR